MQFSAHRRGELAAIVFCATGALVIVTKVLSIFWADAAFNGYNTSVRLAALGIENQTLSVLLFAAALVAVFLVDSTAIVKPVATMTCVGAAFLGLSSIYAIGYLNIVIGYNGFDSQLGFLSTLCDPLTGVLIAAGVLRLALPLTRRIKNV